MLDITNASATNIDAGLYKKQQFDLKLDKYISKVSIQTSNDTKKYEYNKEKLAKVEIKAKQFVGATVVVEYEIEITNEGEIDGFVNEVIDYIPNGFKFNSELNKDWYIGTDKNLHNSSLSNEKIEAGKTKTLKLILTKTLDESKGQTSINYAEIYKASNIENIEDKDSTPGNNVTGEDDISSASLIIAISTGIEKIFVGAIILILILSGGILIKIKKKEEF